MSFNVCRGTLGRLAMFTAIRKASSRVSLFIDSRRCEFILKIDIGKLLTVRRAATYVNRILRGAKLANLPVQAPKKFELVINAKTAKALGVIISPNLLAVSDEVIE